MALLSVSAVVVWCCRLLYSAVQKRDDAALEEKAQGVLRYRRFVGWRVLGYKRRLVFVGLQIFLLTLYVAYLYSA